MRKGHFGVMWEQGTGLTGWEYRKQMGRCKMLLVHVHVC
jgi:hypothetical protein